jgi:hypothetical protein
MEDKNAYKRPKSPYFVWLIISPMFCVWFLLNAIFLSLYQKIGFAIYSMYLCFVWVALFGFHLCNHIDFKKAWKGYKQILQDIQIIENQLKQELEEEPFEEFKENKFTIEK